MVVLVLAGLAPLPAHAKAQTYKPPWFGVFSARECGSGTGTAFSGSKCTFKLSGDRKTGRMKVDSKLTSPEGGTKPGNGYSNGLEFAIAVGIVPSRASVPVSITFRVNSASAETSPAVPFVGGAVGIVGANVYHPTCSRCEGTAFVTVVNAAETPTVKNKTVTVRFSIRNKSGVVPAGGVIVLMWALGVGALGNTIEPNETTTLKTPAVGWARAVMDVTAQKFTIG